MFSKKIYLVLCLFAISNTVVAMNSENPGNFAMYQAMAEWGETDAMLLTGRCLFHGIEGGKQDRDWAEKWYKRAAEKAHNDGDVKILCTLAHSYAFYDPMINEGRACELLDKALAKGHPDATYIKGKLLLQGRCGFIQNDAEGRRLIKEAADSGSKTAILELKRMAESVSAANPASDDN